MSTTYVDNNIIQRALFSISDLIQNKIEYGIASGRNPTEKPSNIIKLTNTDASNPAYGQSYTQYKDKIAEKEEMKIFKRQQEIMSDTTVTSDKLASLLFSNKYSKNTIDTDYHIVHNMILFIEEIPYFFNIDTVNYDNKKFFISDISIKNQSKNVLTLKSDYRINIKIYFTEFDDLLEKSIKVYDVRYPDRHTYVAPLQLLYSYFDTDTNQFGKSLTDGNGLYMTQILKFHKNTETNKQLMTDIGYGELTKNYHLMYMRHNFEMFKNEEPIYKNFENELNIEYASYECDAEDKKVNSRYIPKSSTNLYNLISGENFDKSKSNFCQAYKEQVSSYEDALNNIKVFEQFAADLQNNLKCKEGTKEFENRKEYLQQVKDIKEKTANIKKFTNTTLINYLLDQLFLFEWQIDGSMLGLHETSNFFESLKDNFSFTALGSAAIGGAEIGGGVGAAAAGGAYIVYQTIAAAMSKKIETTNVSLKQLRASIEDGSKATIPLGRNSYSDKIGASKKIMSTPSIGGVIDAGKRLGLVGEEAEKEQAIEDTKQDAYESQITADDLASGKPISIYYTTFGELIKLVASLKEIYDLNAYLIGGYVIDTNIAGRDSSYVNFCNMPIFIGNLVSFLNKQILDRENFKYDTDVFLLDCYENLVKNTLKDGQIVLDSVKKSTPKIVQAHSTVHTKDSTAIPEWIKNLNLLDDAKYKDFKINFLKTKNLNLSRDGIGEKYFFKINTFGTSEEIKYYDFYDSYADWTYENNAANKRFLYNVIEFQEFINKEHLMPCILMKNVADSESFLKKKYVKFSRIDNANAETGNIQNGSGVMRKPYQMSTDLKAYMSFFCDVGSYIFISPPISKLQSNKNMFGFGGLYITKTSEFIYSFQRLVEGNITIPNFDAKYVIVATNVYHGDSLLRDNNILNKESIIDIKCRPSAPAEAEARPIDAKSSPMTPF